MILCFTGTGNSAFVADALAEKLNDRQVSLNRYLKEGIDPVFESEEPFVIVAPIYAWRFPLVIEELIRRAQFRGSRELYCVGTMASQSGNADQYLAKIAAEKGMLFRGYRGVAMPSNFLPGGPMPSAELVEATLNSAIPAIDEIAGIIRAGERLTKTDSTRFARIMSGIVNRGFNKYMVSHQQYTVEETCTGCGLCAKKCPMNNIALTDGKPVFSDKCICCYACIQYCPTESLNIGIQTRNQGRYTCPEYPNTRK